MIHGMTTSSCGRCSSHRLPRIVHACWITALLVFVASPDGEGATKGVGARKVAGWIAGR